MSQLKYIHKIYLNNITIPNFLLYIFRRPSPHTIDFSMVRYCGGESRGKCLIYFPGKLTKRFRVAIWQGEFLYRYKLGKTLSKLGYRTL
jgi:hypothetical protein